MVVVGATKADTAKLSEARQCDPDTREGKQKLNEIAAELTTLAGAHDKRSRGSFLHRLSEYADRGEPLPEALMIDGDLWILTDEDVADMAAYRMATLDLDVVGIERLVVLDDIKVAGTPDRISYYDGIDPDGLPAGHLITDLKTGSLRYGGLKMAAQLASYSRGKLYDPTAPDGASARTELPEDINLRWGIIIHLKPGSATCELWWVDLSVGWRAVELAGEVRAMRRMGSKVLKPFDSAALVIGDEGATVASSVPSTEIDGYDPQEGNW